MSALARGSRGPRPRLYDVVALRHSVALGESYADGPWDSPDLVDLLRIGPR